MLNFKINFFNSHKHNHQIIKAIKNIKGEMWLEK